MADTLSTYRRKRNFAITPEPSGAGRGGLDGNLQYVIQKHWASHLHYDLRLEIDGAMKSWAVPKGPSLDPSQKRMAVQVEDHPIAYNRFEGQIPAGQYGAGRVIIWDKGYWVPLSDPREGYRAGKLHFELHGHKLQGRWTLVRMRGRAQDRQPPWLLIKEADGFERNADDFDIVQAMPDSVGAEPPTSSSKQMNPAQPARKKADKPSVAWVDTLSPQLAVLTEMPPTDADNWAWELKFDGYRMLTRKNGGTVRLLTRNGKDWTAKMPFIEQALASLPANRCWLDGEVVALNAQGIPDFQRLQNAFEQTNDAHLVYFVFDLMFDDEGDLRNLPWTQRRQRLSTLMHGIQSDTLRLSESFESTSRTPMDLLTSACAQGFEGIMGKSKDASYLSKRSANWIKLKCHKRQEFVIGGYTDPKGSRKGLGALLLGLHGDDSKGALYYVGKVGTGFDETALHRLEGQLSALQIDEAPFRNPGKIADRAHWVRPVLIAEVSFAEWTREGRIRHSVFHGLRNDKPASAVHREEPAVIHSEKGRSMKSSSPIVEGVHVSHAERIVDAQSGTTKLDIAHFYAKVAPLMMEHLKGRPVALMRAPDGVRGELFFQKHLQAIDIPGLHQLAPALDPGHAPLVEVSSPNGLIYAAQMNVIEFHTWNAKRDRIERPDRMTLDLDPGEGISWSQVQEGARLVKVLLEQLGLVPFAKTSGGKGLHIVVPIQRRHDWDTVKALSKAIVLHLAKTVPSRFVGKSGPHNRKGKIFVDYLRNGRGATTASAWSVRARPGMGVSVPFAWQELDSISNGAHWNIHNIDARLRTGNSVWDEYVKSASLITGAIRMLDAAATTD